MPTRQSHRVTFLGVLLACVAAVVWMAAPYLLALFLGGMLAMLSFPVYTWLLRKSWRPFLAASAVTTLLLVLVIAPLTGFSILAVKQGIAIGQELAGLKEFSPKAITTALSRWQLVRTVVGDASHVNAKLKSVIQATGEFTTRAVLKLGQSIPEFLLQLTMTLIAFFFFLLDGERFVRWLLGLGVLDGHVQKQLAGSFRETAISAVLAGLAASGAQAALIAAGFLVLDVPGAFLAGGATFILAWLPLLGSFPASLAGVIYLNMQDEFFKMGVMVGIGVAAGIVDNLVRPWVLKGRADMHPLVGLVAILGGIEMFGILGVFIGPILAALLISLLRIWPVQES